MAEFSTEGLEELTQAFLRHEQGAAAAVDNMLQESAKIFVEEQQKEIKAQRIYDTGGFANSIKATEITHNAASSHCFITQEGRAPHGQDYGGGGHGKKGKAQRGNVRYATIGFIFEYGTSSMPARPWLTAANEKAEKKAYEKAQEIWAKYVDGNF